MDKEFIQMLLKRLGHIVANKHEPRLLGEVPPRIGCSQVLARKTMALKFAHDPCEVRTGRADQVQPPSGLSMKPLDRPRPLRVKWL
jgi:hypothetical protein